MSLTKQLLWAWPLTLTLVACKQAPPTPKEPVELAVFFTANVGGEVEPCG